MNIPCQKRNRPIGRLAALLLAALVMIGPASATSANTDMTDLWWNPNKPGNGYQMVNTGTFVFVTGYLFAANHQPFWFSAELDKTGSFPTTFSGPVYVSSGPYFGGPYNPALVTFRQAGTMTFVATSVNTGQLSYIIDGIPAVESVERQPLTLDNYTGGYAGVLTQTVTGCFNPVNNGTVTTDIAIGISQNGQAATVVTTAGTGVKCTISGTYSQHGRMGRIQGLYSCNTGEVGNGLVYQMTNQPYMFMAAFQSQSTNTGCSSQAEVVGVIPR